MTAADTNEGELRWTFVTSSLNRPTGGDIALFEVVNAVRRNGARHCTLVHMPFLDGSRVQSLDDLSWFTFDTDIEHHFAKRLDPAEVPAADVVVYTMKIFASVANTADDSTPDGLGRALRGFTDHNGMPMLFLQGLGVFASAVENVALTLPGVKVCVGRWMVDVLRGRGVPDSDIAHIANGVDPRMFHITHPIKSRDVRVAMNFDPHPVKGSQSGLDAIALAHKRLGIQGTVFGTRSPDVLVAEGIDFVVSPSRASIAEHIYNASSIFLQPSRHEGFGMCAVESMACGCALVTTANGGSDDYAVDGETALVCGPDAAELADSITRLVVDDELRVRLAENGARYVERFRWDASAARLRSVVAAAAARHQ